MFFEEVIGEIVMEVERMLQNEGEYGPEEAHPG